MSSPLRAICPHSLGSSQLFAVPRGLNVHISRMHRDVHPQPHRSSSCLIFTLCKPRQCVSVKKSVLVLRYIIPKGAISSAAGRLCELMDRCLSTNSNEDWGTLLSFEFISLRVPEKKDYRSLTAKVKENIDTSFYAPESNEYTRSSVQNA